MKCRYGILKKLIYIFYEKKTLIIVGTVEKQFTLYLYTIERAHIVPTYIYDNDSTDMKMFILNQNGILDIVTRKRFAQINIRQSIYT